MEAPREVRGDTPSRLPWGWEAFDEPLPCVSQCFSNSLSRLNNNSVIFTFLGQKDDTRSGNKIWKSFWFGRMKPRYGGSWGQRRSVRVAWTCPELTGLHKLRPRSKASGLWPLLKEGASHMSQNTQLSFLVSLVFLACWFPLFLILPEFSSQNTGVRSLSLLQGILPTQGSNPGLPHCRWILYQPSHKGSPRILEWVACPFSSRSSQHRNWTRVSCVAGGFFTNRSIREATSHIAGGL